MEEQFETTEAWKNYALFIKAYISQKGWTADHVAELSGLNSYSLESFLDLKTRMSVKSLFTLVDAIGLVLVFKEKTENQKIEVFSKDDFQIDEEDLKPKALKVERFLEINDSELRILTDGEDLYLCLLDLCDVVKIDYRRELTRVRKKCEFGKEMTLGLLGHRDGSKSELYVIPIKYASDWFLSHRIKDASKHNILMKSYGEFSLELGKVL